MLKALIFDVDGTLAETEEAHRIAFNRAFREFDLDWEWDRDLYKELLLTTGGKERIRAYQSKTGGERSLDIPKIHARKTEIYKDLMATGCVELRPGVAALIKAGYSAGIKLAIATTTSRPNVEVLFENTLGPDWLKRFDAICCGDEVERKKPDPAVYDLAIERLGLPAEDCVAFEDSYAGLISARDAKIGYIAITPSLYTLDHDFAGASIVLRDLASLSSQNDVRVGDSISTLPGLLSELLSSSLEREKTGQAAQ